MKIGSLFNLCGDSHDLLEYFQDIDTLEQLISRLERLKHLPREDVQELLHCIIGLRASLNRVYDETIETSSTIDGDDLTPDDSDDLTPDDKPTDESVAALEATLEEIASQIVNPVSVPATEKPNSSETPRDADPNIVVPIAT